MTADDPYVTVAFDFRPQGAVIAQSVRLTTLGGRPRLMLDSSIMNRFEWFMAADDAEAYFLGAAQMRTTDRETSPNRSGKTGDGT